MNRLSALFAISCTLLLLAAGSASAFPVSVDQTIYFTGTSGTTGGGEFDISLSAYGPKLFGTFCLEYDEHVTYNTPFRVAGITDSANNGGVNTDDGDPISEETKWLYWHFIAGDLDGTTADLLQTTIWHLEEEGDYRTEGNAVDSLIELAENALLATDGFFTEGRVAVMNLVYESTGYHAQDQLIAAPVPEPATLLLLGSGLAGAALLRRRRKK